ncbi:MAG TPA: PDZ domain-containing protein [Firmicutes bacterium]|nr:PDZ domain-containing protein [Bacillota bacterium]
MLLTLLSFILVFSLFAFVHELGHFVAGRACGIKVLEFSIGFGPRFFKTKRGGVIYSLRLLPLGAFVKFAGLDRPEDPAEDIPENDPASFRNKPIWARIATVLAGPLMNFIAAVVIFAVVFIAIGVPATMIKDVEPGRPAAAAGMLPGDRIVEVAGRPARGIGEVRERIMSSPGREIMVVVERDGRRVPLRITPERDPSTGSGLIGVTLQEVWGPAPVRESLAYAWSFTRSVASGLVRALARMATGRMKPDVAGPIGIAQMVGQTARLGLTNLLFLTAVLNVNLGILNLLPIPILDGGWIIMLLFEAIRRRPLTESQETLARLIGLAVIGLIILFATASDIARLSSGLRG